MVKKRGLGKSLDALLAYTSIESESFHASQTSDKLSQLSVDLIQRGKYQPRREMDPQALEDLANSIRMQGVIQPLIVRPIGAGQIGTGQYEIIAGERRWRAAQLAGLTEVPAIIRHIPDEAASAIALIENIQREDLNPIEEASGLERLIKEFGMTHQQVAEAIGKSRTSVTNLLRLLALPETIKDMLESGTLEMGHARSLLTLPESHQLKAADIIVARRLSVRETENLVRQLQMPVQAEQHKPLDPDIARIQQTLSQQLLLPVALQCNAKGKGKLIIHYRNLNELDSLLTRLEILAT